MIDELKDDLLEALRPGFYADWAENLILKEEVLRKTSKYRISLTRFMMHAGGDAGFIDKKKLHDYIAYFKIMIQIHQEMVIAIQQELEEEN